MGGTQQSPGATARRGAEAVGPWRLLLDGARDGARNLAIDEAILERYAASETTLAPTLRLYSWQPAAVSLGRFQAAAVSHDPAYLRGEGLGLVRRPTGGKAVLHEHERTYAVIGHLGEGVFGGGVLETYRQVAGALRAALEALGIDADPGAPRGTGPRLASGPACFVELGIHEIAVGGRKLVGSAQLRRAGAFLQHGSIPLRLRAGRLAAALGADVPLEERALDLERALGRMPEPESLDRAIVSAFEGVFATAMERESLSPGEAARAEWLRCWKYDSASWTLDGHVGERELRWGGRRG